MHGLNSRLKRNTICEGAPVLPPRVNILGVGVSAITMPMVLDIIEGWIVQQETHYVCVTGVHGVMESQRDAELKRIHNRAGLVTPDGMPLVWLCRLGGFSHVERGYGPDLMLALCEQSPEQGYRHFLYGGKPDIPKKLARNLQQRFPGLEIAGIYSPPFRPLSDEEDEQIVKMINETNADVVWVGLGTPKQERWMATHIGRLTAPVLIGVGAAFDFHAGRRPQAPRWIQRSGLEWLFRLMIEPRRLGKRYLINNPMFMLLILLQALGLRQYDLNT
jgi:N-acetylglucosaminyldiphosphoundecaprenol N-acetyl-beta-D-mannosaminyltransferase